jgi:hypothetical protein
VTVISTTFQNNRSMGSGAGILSFGNNVSVIDSAFANNSVLGSASGGGIWASFNLGMEITNSTFSNNGSGGVGAIDLYNTPFTVTNSTFMGNSGGTAGAGGISTNYPLMITNTTFMSNTGGVGALSSGGSATVTNSRFYTNTGTQGGGGISNGGPMTMTKVTVSGNHSPNWYGGGIYNGYGTLSVIGGSITANDALTTTFGGGGGLRIRMGL